MKDYSKKDIVRQDILMAKGQVLLFKAYPDHWQQERSRILEGQAQVEYEPQFLEALENHTVTQGRDVIFTCVVNHLGRYKVAWIKSDSKIILAVHTHLVAHNNRLSVTHNGHNTWKLKVSNVQKNDSGTYMCQINTDPMKSQMGYLEVVIPPDVIDEDGNRDHSANEGGTLKLVCRATGIPAPNVTWRREDGKKIVLRNVVPPEVIHIYTGEVLELANVHRSDMGSYLCIASNGIPPSVSKRYIVQVNFHPKVVVSNQLVAAPVGSDVLLHCYVESWPKAMHSWTRENGIKLMNIPKYHMEEYHINEYSLNMNLTIRDLEKHDFGGYNCSSVNALGKAESTIRLTELHIPTKTTLIPVTHDTGRRKVVIKQKTQPPPTKKPRRKLRIEEPTTPPPVPQIPTRPDWFDQQNEIDGSGYWHRADFLQIFLALLIISAIC